jgi:hypothetical protein
VSIFVLNSDDSDFSDLADSLGKYIELERFDDEKDLIASLAEEGDAVLLNLDDQIKKKDKLIKKLKAKYDDLPVFVLCNELEPKKMAKHQSSKLGAHLYFRTPVDETVLLELLGEYFEIESDGGAQSAMATAQLESIHDETNVGVEAKDASEGLDDVMSSVFVEEYSEAGIEAEAKITAENENGSLDEINLDHVVVDGDEFSLDEDELDLSGEDELSVIETTIEDSDFKDDGFSLDSDDELIEEADGKLSAEEDLSLSGQEDETIFPDADDLEFPEPTKTNVKLPDTAELSLSEGDDMAPDDGVAEEEGFSFDVDESLDLSFSDAGEEVESFEMDDGAIDLSAESEKLVVDEDLSSASQVFDLGKVEDVAPEVDDIGMEFGLDEDDVEFNLGTSAEILTDLEEDIVVGEDIASNEITKPISTAQLSELNLDEVVTVDESDDLDLSFSVSSDDNDKLDDEEDVATLLDISNDLAGSTPEIDDLSFDMESDEDTATIVGVAIGGNSVDELMAAEDDEPTIAAMRLADEDLPEFSETVERKIQEIDEMLVEDEAEEATKLFDSTDLPEAPIDFTVDEVEEDEEEDATRVFSASDVIESQEYEEEIEKLEKEEGTKVFTAENLSNLQQEVARPNVDTNQIFEHREYVKTHDDELMRLGETIKTLREDRDLWMSKVSDHESKKETEKKDFLNIHAQLDESKIEISIMKKRFSKQIDELKYQLDLSDDRKEALLIKNRQFEQEFESLNKKTKVDVHQVRARERELEEKLEMLKADAEIQVKNRDHKILELKRRIDTLEFDIESSHAKEQKTVTGKNDLEDKMEKVIQTLRSAINHLEDDQGNDERMRRIKKSLDV